MSGKGVGVKGQAMAEGYRRQRFGAPGQVLIQIEDIRCGGFKKEFLSEDYRISQRSRV